MVKRPTHRIPQGIRTGRIVDWPAGVGTPEEVAVRVRYAGSSLHKNYPSPAGPPALRADKSKCDRFAVEDWPRLLEALQQAIRAECVDEFRGGFPSRAWMWVNNVLHKARLHNVYAGEYHGFPINDPRQYPLPLDKVEAAPRANLSVV